MTEERARAPRAGPPRGRTLIGVLLLLVACACQSLPPASATSRYGVVRGFTQQAVERGAAALDQVVPYVLDDVPGTRCRTLELWVIPGPFQRVGSDTSMDGITWSSDERAFMMVAAGLHMEHDLAHECVHALLDSSWQTLPQIVQEGLCDHVSDLWPGGESLTKRAGKTRLLTELGGGFTLRYLLDDGRAPLIDRQTLPGDPAAPRARLAELLSTDAWAFAYDLPGSMTSMGYAVGDALVDGIAGRGGLALLHGLCLQAAGQGLAEVPRERLFESAGIVDDPEGWARVVADRVDPAVAYRLADDDRADIAPELVEVLRRRFPEDATLTWAAFLDAHPLSVLVQPGGVRVRLSNRSALLQFVGYAWMHAQAAARR